MEQKQNLTGRARDSMEKAAFVALGAPTAALKALGARVSDLRDTVRSSRKELSEDLSREIDEWVSEGEELIGRAMKRIRRSDVIDDVRSTARSTGEVARSGLDKARGMTRSGIEVLEPDSELTAISGIGSSYEEKLGAAGVVGISRFIDRTARPSDIDDLAKSTGISAEVLSGWRDQVDLTRLEGVGASSQLLLHRLGVWTLDDLASAAPDELAEQMRALDLPDVPDQLPTEDVIRRWRDSARSM